MARVLSQVLATQVSALRRRKPLRFAAAAPDGPCPAPFYLTPDEAESIYSSLSFGFVTVMALPRLTPREKMPDLAMF